MGIASEHSLAPMLAAIMQAAGLNARQYEISRQHEVVKDADEFIGECIICYPGYEP